LATAITRPIAQLHPCRERTVHPHATDGV